MDCKIVIIDLSSDEETAEPPCKRKRPPCLRLSANSKSKSFKKKKMATLTNGLPINTIEISDSSSDNESSNVLTKKIITNGENGALDEKIDKSTNSPKTNNSLSNSKSRNENKENIESLHSISKGVIVFSPSTSKETDNIHPTLLITERVEDYSSTLIKNDDSDHTLLTTERATDFPSTSKENDPADPPLLEVERVVEYESYVNESVEPAVKKETEKMHELSKEFLTFIDAVKNALKKERHLKVVNQRIDGMKKYYQKLGPSFTEHEKFKKTLTDATASIANRPKQILVYFTEVFVEMAEAAKAMPVDNSKRIKRLELILKRIHRKIEKLNETEVDFDDDNNAYVKKDRYEKGACRVYKALCKYKKMDYYGCRPLYNKLNFKGSKHEHINKAINKTFRDFDTFVNAKDVLKNVKKYLKHYNIKVFATDEELEEEVVTCCRDIAKIIQKRRKEDLFAIHTTYLKPESKDPAESDEELAAKLKDSEQRLHSGLKKVFDHFAQKQREETEIRKKAKGNTEEQVNSENSSRHSSSESSDESSEN